MLLDREGERSRIDRLIDDARKGTSGTLLLRGEAGIGKSELLRYAVERAHGMEVLQASGVESEIELPFSVLAQLLQPILSRLPRIPEPQAAALSGALALAPEVSGDRFAVSAATLSLFAAAAEERPVLAVVDDAHWVDGSSRDAILFAARRLGAEGVAIIFAARESVDGFPPGTIPELVLTGLPGVEAAALVAIHAGPELTREVADRLVAATAGNPLALVETPELLNERQLAGDEPLPEPLPAGPSVTHAFLQRVSALPKETRRALVVTAASETGSAAEVMAALTHLGVATSGLDAAEAADLIRIEEGEIRFRHPLLRSAVYQAAWAPERRAAHRAFGSVLDAAKNADRRAWHLARAVTGPDEQVAQALEYAALEARRRSGHAAAGSAFERAAMLTPDAQDRARRLLEAARDLHVAGRIDRAADLLDDALNLVEDPIQRADMQLLRARIEMFRGTPMSAHARLVDEAERVAPIDPERAAIMLAEAVFPCLMSSRTELGLKTGLRAYAMAEDVGGSSKLAAGIFLATVLALRGERARARELVMQSHAVFIAADPLATIPMAPPLAAALEWLEEHELGTALLIRAIAAARGVGAAGLLPLLLATKADFAFRAGLWAAATADASEADALAIDTGQPSLRTYGLVALARVEAGQGREAACRAHALTAAEMARAAGIRSVLYFTGSALGLLSLSAGRPQEAISHLEPVADMYDRDGAIDLAAVQWGADLIEAYIRAGRIHDAEHALDVFSINAERARQVWALATAARCRGMLAAESDLEAAFEEAVRWHGRLAMPFEQARTEFCFGERLRRAKRVAEAREMLHRALDGFEHLGAAVWAERARTELRATGDRVPREPAAGPRELTAQELQVALLVAEGATNREVAAALFLSPKTVEFHLGHVYAKLGVRSRTELARILPDRRTPLVLSTR
jgi:DNA-binding CsgD family transcriptional regulator